MTYWKGEKPPTRHWKGEKRAFDFSDDTEPGKEPPELEAEPEPELPISVPPPGKASPEAEEDTDLEEWVPRRFIPSQPTELSRTGVIVTCVLVFLVGGLLFFGIWKLQNHNETVDFTGTVIAVTGGYEGTSTVTFDDGRKMDFKPGAIDGKLRIGDQVHMICSKTYHYWSVKELEILAIQPAT